MPIACLALGANLGNCTQTFKKVSLALSVPSRQIQLIASSSVYTTPPYQGGKQPDYYNQVLLIDTSFSPFQLLKTCLQIEAEFGRKRNLQEKWESRVIDIDILYYGSEVIHNDSLQIPHYDLVNRAFFLKPLCEIVPQWQDPILNRSVLQIWNELCPKIQQEQLPRKV